MSLKKSIFQPQMEIEFLGLLINTEKTFIRVPENKYQKFRGMINDILAHNRCDYKKLEKLRGTAISFLQACPVARLLIRRMTAALTRSARLGYAPICVDQRLTEELTNWLTLEMGDIQRNWG